MQVASWDLGECGQEGCVSSSWLGGGRISEETLLVQVVPYSCPSVNNSEGSQMVLFRSREGQYGAGESMGGEDSSSASLPQPQFPHVRVVTVSGRLLS